MINGHDEIAVFLGLDVGKSGHHAVAQDRSGKKRERDKPWEATRPGALDRLCG